MPLREKVVWPTLKYVLQLFRGQFSTMRYGVQTNLVLSKDFMVDYERKAYTGCRLCLVWDRIPTRICSRWFGILVWFPGFVISNKYNELQVCNSRLQILGRHQYDAQSSFVSTPQILLPLYATYLSITLVLSPRPFSLEWCLAIGDYKCPLQTGCHPREKDLGDDETIDYSAAFTVQVGMVWLLIRL